MKKDVRIDDIKSMIDKVASRDEKLELAVILDEADEERGLNGLSQKEKKDLLSGENLAETLWYQYQTLGGYIWGGVTEEPPLEKMCYDIAKKMKIHGAIDKDNDNAWEMLDAICTNMLSKVVKKAAKEQGKSNDEVLRDIIGAREYGKLKRQHGGDASKLLTAGGAFWIRSIGFAATRNLILHLVHQTARAFLGHGLSFVASQTVLKTAAKTASKALVWANPVGWFLTIWALNDLTGTNYKRVVPACLLLYAIHIEAEAKLAAKKK